MHNILTNISIFFIVFLHLKKPQTLLKNKVCTLPTKEFLCRPCFALGLGLLYIPREISHTILVVSYIPPVTKSAMAWEIIHLVTARLRHFDQLLQNTFLQGAKNDGRCWEIGGCFLPKKKNTTRKNTFQKSFNTASWTLNEPVL